MRAALTPEWLRPGRHITERLIVEELAQQVLMTQRHRGFSPSTVMSQTLNGAQWRGGLLVTQQQTAGYCILFCNLWER